MNQLIHVDDVEVGVEVFEDNDVLTIGHGIPQVPLVGMMLADCGNNINLLEDVTNVTKLLQLA